MTLFRVLIASHILTGSIGLVAFWVPVVARKGGVNHRNWGRVFTISMLATGFAAVGISICTILDPVGLHPQITPDIGDEQMIRGIFGWMMLGLAILTINLTWYGWLCISCRNRHEGNLEWRNLSLQYALIAAALTCAWQAHATQQPLLLGMTAIGLATAGTNLRYLYKPKRTAHEWQKEHIKGLIGTGISVYTAFLAFGAVRTFPRLALHPGLWAIPLVVGLALIVRHRRDVERRYAGARVSGGLTP